MHMFSSLVMMKFRTSSIFCSSKKSFSSSIKFSTDSSIMAALRHSSQLWIPQCFRVFRFSIVFLNST